ncbi:MAG TPA: hypothetical protein QF353_02660 [Gammaproteobacteria bacterium]|nr:hypothetical protein [Gammaproteobacteria bacterium]
MLMLGGLYQEGKIGEEPDYDKAKEWCEKAMKAVKRLRVQSKHIDNDLLKIIDDDDLEDEDISFDEILDNYHKKNSM